MPTSWSCRRFGLHTHPEVAHVHGCLLSRQVREAERMSSSATRDRVHRVSLLRQITPLCPLAHSVARLELDVQQWQCNGRPRGGGIVRVPWLGACSVLKATISPRNCTLCSKGCNWLYFGETAVPQTRAFPAVVVAIGSCCPNRTAKKAGTLFSRAERRASKYHSRFTCPTLSPSFLFARCVLSNSFPCPASKKGFLHHHKVPCSSVLLTRLCSESSP